MRRSSRLRPAIDCNNRGFTLMEIIVAVSVLGMGLAIILGLQQNYLKIYDQERNLTRAALFAQYLMTVAEVQQQPPAAGQTQGDLADALKESGYFDGETGAKEEDELRNWEFSRSVESIELMGFPDVMRKIDLTVAWGSNGNQRFHLVYYRHTAKTQGADGTRLGGAATPSGETGGGDTDDGDE